eukprot:CAMPEP_0185278808 /NCGR_PEP_ID=MMETSP1359-20130426/61948_1 /TAXON_ID=552665 /ORGANISM="Bigelowiella longifila, Strain CCMP242" /LENGTH=176 /DNA_ID=CAMNT_0027873449 /DNA_START=124 /DNA_END=654 /DNA_ORIENTATION=-
MCLMVFFHQVLPAERWRELWLLGAIVSIAREDQQFRFAAVRITSIGARRCCDFPFPITVATLPLHFADVLVTGSVFAIASGAGAGAVGLPMEVTATAYGGNALDQRVVVRFEEKGHRVACLGLFQDDTMSCRPVVSVRPSCQHIAEIHHERALYVRNIDPGVRCDFDLQAGRSVRC